MLILGVDFETTGLSLTEDRIIEVGAVLWDTETHKPVKMYNELVKPEGVTELSEHITKLTGITFTDLERWGLPETTVFGKLYDLMTMCDAALAHNGNIFDKPFADNTFERLQFKKHEAHWIDSTVDIDFDESVRSRSLVYLAAVHGFLNPFAHRALFDVLTMLRVADQYNWEEVLALSKQPSIRLKAMVSYSNRQKAKDNGFYWDGDNKQWVKTLKESKVKAFIESCDFDIKYLGEENVSA